MNDINPPRPFGQRPIPKPWQSTFEFEGSSGEYFRIWIVNLLLTIVTFGIYSAWAKVRRLRYFYGNTFIDGHNFDYHADPVRILIGRIIVFGGLFTVNILSNISPLFLLLLLPYLAALPWIINQSIAFNAQVTSYRNVRFSFRGSYLPALGVFVLMPMAALLSIGLLAPVASRLSRNYIGNRLRFGTSSFATDAPLGRLYANLGYSAAVFVAGSILLAGAALVTAILTGSLQQWGSSRDQAISAVLVSFVLTYAMLFIASYVYGAGVRNIAFNATTLQGGHHLSSDMSRLRYAWILVSNAILTMLTLGLMWPWAAVRNWRYFAVSTSVVTTTGLDAFIGASTPSGSVTASEYLDVGGVDIGL